MAAMTKSCHFLPYQADRSRSGAVCSREQTLGRCPGQESGLPVIRQEQCSKRGFERYRLASTQDFPFLQDNRVLLALR
jgi:hypothetical protein